MNKNRRLKKDKLLNKSKKISFESLFRPSNKDSVNVEKNGNIKKKVAGKSYKANPLHVFFVALCIFIAGAALVYHLHIRFEGVRLGYEASKARRLQTRLMLKRRELRLELASMKDPGFIEDEAREKLAMEPPEFDKIIPVNRKQRVVSVSGGAL